MSEMSETEQVTMEPCPFCGAAAVLRYEGLAVDAAFDSQPYGRINCSEGTFRCCPELQFEPGQDAEATAVKEWNTRAVLTATVSLVKDGGGLAPERLIKRVCKDGFIDCGYHPKSEARDVEYVRTDLIRTNTTEDVGHPRVNGWPCVCAECVSKRSRASVVAPQGDAYGPLRAAIEIAETYRAARDGWRDVPTRHEIQDIISKYAAPPTGDGCSIVLHQTNDGHHHWLCPNCRRKNVSQAGTIDLKTFLPSVICCECGFEFGVDKSALPATTEERS